MSKKTAPILLTSMLLLIVLGLIMQISIGPYAIGGADDHYAEARRHVMYTGLGLTALFIAFKIDYRRYAQWNWVLYTLALLGLAACFVPGIQRVINGAHRWIYFPGGTLQPSEFAKIVGIIVIATWCARRPETRRTFTHGFITPMLIGGVLIFGIAIEVDLGNASLLTVGMLSVLYAAGAKLRYLGVLILSAAAGLTAAIMAMPERMGRIMAFLDLEKYRAGDGLQQWLSLMAYGTGGADGLGLGNSRQKMWSLPYANSDMISAIIGEELGGWFTIFMVLCYVALTVSGFYIAIHAPDRFGKLLGFGLVSLLAMQTVIHMGVTTAMLPNKGMPLPFVSAGGSNIICLMLAVGILLNIYKQSTQLDHQDALLGRAKFTPAV